MDNASVVCANAGGAMGSERAESATKRKESRRDIDRKERAVANARAKQVMDTHKKTSEPLARLEKTPESSDVKWEARAECHQS